MTTDSWLQEIGWLSREFFGAGSACRFQSGCAEKLELTLHKFHTLWTNVNQHLYESTALELLYDFVCVSDTIGQSVGLQINEKRINAVSAIFCQFRHLRRYAAERSV